MTNIYMQYTVYTKLYKSHKKYSLPMGIFLFFFLKFITLNFVDLMWLLDTVQQKKTDIYKVIFVTDITKKEFAP